MVTIMMNQQFSFPGRKTRCGGGCDRALYRPRTGRSMSPCGGLGCGGRMPTNRDMNPGSGTPCAGGRRGCMEEPDMNPTYPGCGCGEKPPLSPVPPVRPCGEKRPCEEKRPCQKCADRHADAPSCGQDASPTPACRKLMEQIRAVDFALYETILYLDVYPHSCEALATYHKLKAQREELHRAYESTVGPISAFGNESTTSWDWMNKPFPWEYDANR